MNNRYKKAISWDEKAKQNPLYAIMSDSDFENLNAVGFSEEQIKKFYDKGRWIWETYIAPALLYSEKKENLNVLEWGCGMGRVLVQAANSNFICSGVDISATQLELLNRYFPNPVLPETRLYLTLKPVDFKSEAFDLIYSYAVLQHIKSTSEVLFAVNEMCRLLKKGGVLKIQFRCIDAKQTLNKIIPVFIKNYENSTAIVYVRRYGLLFIPKFRYIKHDHWTGAGSYIPVKNYISILKKHNLDIISFEHSNIDKQPLAWITAKK